MRRNWLVAAVFLVVVLAAITAAMRFRVPRMETVAITALAPDETNPQAFATFYPRHYDSYLRNARMEKAPSRYGGSKPESKLAQYPAMSQLWAGYAFAKEYNEDRGHTYALEDVGKIKRVTEKTTATCMTCKSADVPGLLVKYGDSYYTKPFTQIKQEVKHPIGCSDCHNPPNMSLRITRPALRSALAEVGIDADKADRQEMRTLVCAQCHVEYYFKPGSMVVTFPWTNGYDPEQIFAYYNTVEPGFSDWIHPQSGTAMLKAQHPDFEMFQGSVHQEAGVACADCHMPYMVQGNTKVTSHWWTSPLKHVEESCLSCHRQSKEELVARVFYTQDRMQDLFVRAGEANIGAIHAIEEAARAPKADKVALGKARALHREAQWYWDWVGAESSAGFHNPQKAIATLGKSIDLAYKARDIARQAQERR